MNQYLFDNFFLGLKPLELVHRFGVNGKISGNLAAIHEIKEAVPLIYGPIGCGFHYHQSARSRNTAYSELEVTAFDNKDVIFSGENTLRRELLHIDKQHHPKMIFILPSVVSDIMNDDIVGMVSYLQVEVDAKLVIVRSQAFSHMDKTNTNKRLQEKAQQPDGAKSVTSVVYAGCGYVEVMDAIVEQVMEKQEVCSASVNIESFIWGYGSQQKIGSMWELLRKMGIRVNTLLPAASLQQLQQAPKAALNIVRRKKWAMTMEKRFGTPFLHVADMQEWHGLDGICDFYRSIGKKLGLAEQVEQVLQQELSALADEYAEYRRSFSKYSFMLITGALSGLPEQIKAYEQDYGLPLSAICLTLPTSFQAENGLSEETLQKMYDNIQQALDKCDSKARIYVNPSSEEMLAAAGKCDFLLGTSNPYYAFLHKPMVSNYIDRPVFDFAGFMEIMAEFAAFISREHVDYSHLLLNKMDFDPLYYPLQKDDSNSLASKEMYNRLWRLRKK